MRQEERDNKPERRRLKTTRLKEYTIKSHSSMPPNNTYVNFERFSQVLEEIASAEEGLKDLERNQRSCREDIAALLSIYEEKEGWYKEENQSISSDLTNIRQDLQRTQTQRKKSQEDARLTIQSANILKRKFGRLENRYEVLAEQVASEVRWVEELVKSMSAGKDSLGMPWTRPTFNNDTSILKYPPACLLCLCLTQLSLHGSVVIISYAAARQGGMVHLSRSCLERQQEAERQIIEPVTPSKDSFLSCKLIYYFKLNFRFVCTVILL